MSLAGEKNASTQDLAPRAVCVLGMHRSGTSALARLLNLLGVDLGDNLLPGRIDNPRGFWEHRGILGVHDELLDVLHSSFDDFMPLEPDWHRRPDVAQFRSKLIDIVRADFKSSSLWGFKDPRTCRLVPMWSDIFDELGANGQFVFVIRDPREIAMSLEARDGYSFNTSLLLTLTHLLEAERATRGKPRVFVSFEQVLGDWRNCASRIGRELGIVWPRGYSEIEKEVAGFLEPGLRHHAVSASTENSSRAAGADPDAVRWVFAAHGALMAAAEGQAVDGGLLDELRGQFDGQRPRLISWRPGRSPQRQLMKLDAWSADMREENNWLKLGLLRLGLEPKDVIAALVADPDGKKDLVEEASGDRGPGKQASAELARLQVQIQAMNTQLGDLARQNTELEKRIAWFSTHAEQLEKHAAELKSAIAWLQGQKEAAEGVVAEKTEQTARFEAELARRQDDVARLTHELHQRRQEISSLKSRTAELEAYRAQLLRDHALHVSELAHRDQRIASLEAWSLELDTTRRWLAEQLEGARIEVERGQSTNEQCRKWIVELETAKAWLADQRDKLEAELKLRSSEAAVASVVPGAPVAEV
ncbi:MAG: hypothetical protein M3O30_05675 [Planctomycetota bacterium]|nr:hypothetical protein [Planctomycetota bacterium]